LPPPPGRWRALLAAAAGILLLAVSAFRTSSRPRPTAAAPLDDSARRARAYADARREAALGLRARDEGRLDDSDGHYRRAMALTEEAGSKDVEFTKYYGILADHYANAGRREEAWELQQRIVDFLTRVLGPDDPETAAALHGLAVARSLYAGSAATPIVEESRVKLAASGADPSVQTTANSNLAQQYIHQEHSPEKARPLLAENVRLMRESAGAGSTMYILRLAELADFDSQHGSPDQADLEAAEVRRLAEKHLGDGEFSPAAAAALVGALKYVADNAGRRGRPAEEILVLEGILRWNVRYHVPDDVALWNGRDLAEAYARAGRAADAERIFSALLPQAEKSFGEESVGICGLLKGYAGVLRTLGRSAQADELMRRYARIQAAAR